MFSDRPRYFLCVRKQSPAEFDIHNYRERNDGIFLSYWIKVFQYLEENFCADGLRFYVMWNDSTNNEIPEYGDDVVAVVLMDEYCIVPRYAERIRLVFKTYGFLPWADLSHRGKTPAFFLKLAKDCVTWGYHQALFLAARRKLTPFRRGHVVPLGYGRQADLPIKPFEARQHTISFVGSIAHDRYHPLSPRALLGTPKSVARRRMAKALERLSAELPGHVFFGTTGSFAESVLNDGARYSEIVADTRICLAPRGSSVETYRFFEGLRQGCVVICDRLPPHWFYAGSPAIQLDDWRDLGPLVHALLADPERLLELHRRSLAWWRTICSEAAVATVLAQELSLDTVPCAASATA